MVIKARNLSTRGVSASRCGRGEGGVSLRTERSGGERPRPAAPPSARPDQSEIASSTSTASSCHRIYIYICIYIWDMTRRHTCAPLSRARRITEWPRPEEGLAQDRDLFHPLNVQPISRDDQSRTSPSWLGRAATGTWRTKRARRPRNPGQASGFRSHRVTRHTARCQRDAGPRFHGLWKCSTALI